MHWFERAFLVQAPANPVLQSYPNTRSNVFLMMRFRPTEYHGQISKTIERVLSEYSLNLIRADANDYTPQLWDNVEACMNACDYGIAVFEQIDERDINPNVSLELGYMRGQGKKCLLLKEKRLPALQTDLSGYLYSEFDAFQIDGTIEPQVRRWLRSIGIAKKSNERLLVFVSAGGTCRCALAKAITGALLEARPPAYPLRVMSTAMYEPALTGASEGARGAIKELFGRDLLADHRAMRLTPTLVEEADLILVMDHAIYDVLRKAGSPNPDSENARKIHVLKPYFGLAGDIADPWPHRNSGDSDALYLSTAKELQSILEQHLSDIIEALDPQPKQTNKSGSAREHHASQANSAENPSVIVSQQQTDTVTVLIEITVSGVRHTCEIPLDIRVARLLPVLFQKLGLPTRDAAGIPMDAYLFSKSQDRRLESSLTLRENGVRDREVLQIQWSATAG